MLFPFPRDSLPFDESDPEPVVSPDTPNQTKINYQEVSEPELLDAFQLNRGTHSKRWEMKLFQRMNSGRGNRLQTNRKLLQKMDRLARFDAISSQLGMTTYQKRVGRYLREHPVLRNLGFRDEIVALSLCTFVCRYGKYAQRTPESERDIYHPCRKAENNDKRFVDLVKSLGIREREMQKCMGKMRHKLPDYITS